MIVFIFATLIGLCLIIPASIMAYHYYKEKY